MTLLRLVGMTSITVLIQLLSHNVTYSVTFNCNHEHVTDCHGLCPTIRYFPSTPELKNMSIFKFKTHLNIGYRNYGIFLDRLQKKNIRDRNCIKLCNFCLLSIEKELGRYRIHK